MEEEEGRGGLGGRIQNEMQAGLLNGKRSQGKGMDPLLRVEGESERKRAIGREGPTMLCERRRPQPGDHVARGAPLVVVGASLSSSHPVDRRLQSSLGQKRAPLLPCALSKKRPALA